MSPRALNMVGLGESLWDLLPDGKQLGGAPTNFAYMCNLLGDRGIVASRIGNDALGDQIASTLEQLQVNTSYMQRDPNHPTGSVAVQFEAEGQPSYTIREGVAWDFLEWTPEWARLASQADVVCFGTLAQRSPLSRAAIQQFVRSAGAALRIFDVNLRPPFYSEAVLRQSLELAQVLKLNDLELPVVAGLLGIAFRGEHECAQRLLTTHGLKLVCVTRGAQGSLLVDSSRVSEHPGFRVSVADTVGAGDAFTACMAHHVARHASLETINAEANRFAAWVASRHGGTPSLAGQPLHDALSAIAKD
jgi:fructokinase